MKQIPLSRGKFAIVDDEDYDFLMQWKWCISKSYAMRIVINSGKRKTIYMHRLILNAPDGMQVDHVNEIGLDNRKSNLRICNQSENQRNRSKQKNNTSGFKGVHWHVIDKRWMATIKVDKKKIHLGSFRNPIDAAKVYNSAAIKYHGEFANLNEIP